MTRHFAVLGRACLAAAGFALALPAGASAHVLTERYQAPLPLAAYVLGAALAVAMSFAFVMLRSAPRSPAAEAAPDTSPARPVPGWLRVGLGALGLLAWAWIVGQTLFGGGGEGDVASLFVWVYGWVGVALVSALIGPAWSFLDPFSTLHRGLEAATRRLGIGNAADATGGRGLPERLGAWPAAVGFAIVVWLELVARIEGGRTLGLLLIGYTFVTLAGMSLVGRDEWRQRGEVFSVWFGLLGRLAPYALDGPPEEGRLRRQPLGTGLRRPWPPALLALLTLGTGSIIFDGLSQTEIYFRLFGPTALPGMPAMLVDSIVLVVFMAVLLGLVFGAARVLGTRALGAGLLPVAVGYLIAHYLTFLLVDGQRIVLALNDPLQRGDNLLPLDLGFHEPVLFLPSALIWSIQLAAVVGGHVVGAWAGHAALVEERGRPSVAQQLPLAGLMILLTSVTLWSLGQAVILEPH
ncbi:MAG TPA: hypothetical protein VNW68_02475 [Candidatus Limnocylindria bacterium]|nr:hypothetical protein [Candidatus Limnocylindria bacterium]